MAENLPKPVELVNVKFEPSSTPDPKKSPILIHHGIFSCKESWTTLAKEISELTGRIVYCFDVRDHGESQWTNEFTYQAMISDQVNFMKENKIEKAILIGHSLGGMIYSRMVTLFPNLAEKLILVDIHPKKTLKKDGPNMVQIFAYFLRDSLNKLRDEKLELEAAKERLNELLEGNIKDPTNRNGLVSNLVMRDGQLSYKYNIDELIKFLDTLEKIEDVIPNWSGPCLEIYGSLSPFINKDDYESILKLLPNTEFICIEGGDHILHTTHPKEFLSNLLPFLEK